MRAFDRDLICGGHYGQRPVCRANRPNTWLHRPACKREENPCQLGAVHTWHIADMAVTPSHVCFQVQGGHDLRTARGSAYDPKRTLSALQLETARRTGSGRMRAARSSPMTS